ncbi:hypothetical protein [Plantibacter sp. LMC-P-059a]|uniref:hypothetical protein n=1 Tax=Plantibacter sp. LMC-P-059a TaxID=3040297 RepID=UPI00254F83AB|nr:hypothetical protein [Plantibacter sp. LMC-P-059a]
MKPLLSHDVTMFRGVTQMSGVPARIELHDDRFVLSVLDRTGQPSETVMDTPLSALQVGGSMALLTFKVGDLKRRVDFSFAARAAMVRPGGVLAVGPILKESGIYPWLAAFRARGVRVRYFSLGHIWLVSLGAVAIIVAVVAAIGVASVT